MKYNSEKYVGFRSGYLTVLSYNNGKFLCQCDCGRLITANAWSIANYKKKSCSSREYKDLHGEEKYNKVVESVSEMLLEKGITITELELKMLVEAAVGEFNKVFETDTAITDSNETE